MTEVKISRKVQTDGNLLNDDIYLVCNGVLEGANIVKLSSRIYFSHAVQCSDSEQDHPPGASYIIMAPLHQCTAVTIFIKEGLEDFQARFVFNFQERKFYLESLNPNGHVLTDRLAASIFSCFGIKKGKAVTYLRDFFHINTCKN